MGKVRGGGEFRRDRFDFGGSLASFVSALSDTNSSVLGSAAQSLGKMHCNEPVAAEALNEALERELHQEGNEIVRWKIIDSPGRLGATARPAFPMLTKLIDSTNYLGVLAVIALSEIEPEEPRWIDALIGRLAPNESGDAFWAAVILGPVKNRAICCGPTRGMRTAVKTPMRASSCSEISCRRLSTRMVVWSG